MESKVYNKEGKAAGKVTLPEGVFASPWNADLVHQVVVSMMSNARGGNAHTKFRNEVSGTGAKPWKQKGTGRARHGSRRSNIWRTGGVTHGPRNDKDYSKKINKKMRNKALAATLSKKLEDGEILFVDDFGLEAPKAADAKKTLGVFASVKGFEALGTKQKNAALVVLSGRDENTEKSFQNFGNVLVEQAQNLNPVELLTYKYVVIANPTESVNVLKTRILGAENKAK